MTSGNIRMGPDPDRILEALKEALRDDPKMRERPAEEISVDLARGGYLDEEPDPVLVADMLGSIDPEGPGRETDETTEEANPTYRAPETRQAFASRPGGFRRGVPRRVNNPRVSNLRGPPGGPVYTRADIFFATP